MFEIQDAEVRRAKLEEYKALQQELNSWGVTEVVLMAIATHPAGDEGNAADEGLELLQEMALYGNRVVQDFLIDWINVMDKDSKLLTHFKERILLSMDIVRARKTRSKADFLTMTPVEREEYVNAQQSYHLLKTLCEGHNLTCQNILREQPQHQGADVNVVQTAVDFLVYLAEDGASLKRMENLEVELLFDG